MGGSAQKGAQFFQLMKLATEKKKKLFFLHCSADCKTKPISSFRVKIIMYTKAKHNLGLLESSEESLHAHTERSKVLLPSLHQLDPATAWETAYVQRLESKASSRFPVAFVQDAFHFCIYQRSYNWQVWFFDGFTKVLLVMRKAMHFKSSVNILASPLV